MKESERGKAEMKKYISIDIGGTAIKYGIVSEDAEGGTDNWGEVVTR